jgi:ferredoxin
MKIVVNRDRCEANGVCVRAAPAAFRLDDADQLHVLAEEVPPALLEQVTKAVRTCPKAALALVQGDAGA